MTARNFAVFLIAKATQTFVNLMEEHETDHAGKPFVPYQDLAATLCPEVTCVRYPIRDLSATTAANMIAILDAINESLNAGRPVYVHCWGGVGRTGTVIGCWLLQHKLADPADVQDVLMRLRQQDRERRNRMSPETGAQQKFVEKITGTGALTAKLRNSESPRLEAGSRHVNSLYMPRELTWHELGLRRFGWLRQATQVVGCQCLAANEAADSVNVT